MPVVLSAHQGASPRLQEPRSVVVIGGGLAGIAAAVVLAERGMRVTLA